MKKLNPCINFPSIFIFREIFYFLPYLPYIWNLDKIIHNVSILMIRTGNEILVLQKNCWQQNCIFFVLGKCLISNLAFVIRWEKSCVVNSFCKIRFRFFFFLVSCLNFFQFLRTASMRLSFILCNNIIGIFSLLVVCNPKIWGKCFLFTRALDITGLTC